MQPIGLIRNLRPDKQPGLTVSVSNNYKNVVIYRYSKDLLDLPVKVVNVYQLPALMGRHSRTENVVTVSSENSSWTALSEVA